MPLYLDIAAVHIQRYLSRTPTLEGRRGASAALVAATQKVLNDTDLAALAEINREAGEVDGVLSLVLPDGDASEATLTKVLDRALALLRAELPGAEFQAVWGAGDSYLTAYTGPIMRNREKGDVRVDLPAGAGFPAVLSCAVCHTDPATETLPPRGEETEERKVCADCHMRLSRETRELGYTSEGRLTECVGAPDRPDGFEGLAELGDPASGRTHLATVHADGNRVGEFFSEVAQQEGADRARIVEGLSTCTFEALAAATCAVRREQAEKLCVVPHLIGGDDVLVSLPADRGWKFTITFLHEFGEGIRRLLRKYGLDQMTPPTMSAGLVFSRKNFPFTLLVEETERCLRGAKSAGAGKRSGIQFVDITTDGPGAPGQAVPLATLRAHRQALNKLSKMPRSHRYRLAEELRDAGPTTVRTLAARLGRTDTLAPFFPDERDTASPEAEDRLIDVAQALRITRWWRR